MNFGDYVDGTLYAAYFAGFIIGMFIGYKLGSMKNKE